MNRLLIVIAVLAIFVNNFRTFGGDSTRIAISESASDHYQKGLNYYYNGDLESAKKEFESSLDIDSKFAEGHYGLGLVFARMRNTKKLAIKEFRKALKLKKDFVDAHYHLGLTYAFFGGSYTKLARREFLKVIELDPDYDEAYDQLGKMLIGQNKYKEVITIFRKAIHLDPENTKAYCYLGTALFGRKEYQRAIETLDKALQIDPGFAMAHLNLSQVYVQLGDNDKAMEHYLSALDCLYDKRTMEELYTDIMDIMTEEERGEFENAPIELKGSFFYKFWKRRDPTPTTIENERFSEHQRRLSYARANYSYPTPPGYDHRGVIYVRHGEPNDKVIMPMGDRYSLPNEAWLYFRKGERYVFDFIDLHMTGFYTVITDVSRLKKLSDRAFERRGLLDSKYAQYVYEIDPNRKREILREISLDRTEDIAVGLSSESFRPDFGGEPLAFVYDFADFRNNKHETKIEVYYGIPFSELASEGKEGKPHLEIGMSLFDQEWIEVESLTDSIIFKDDIVFDELKGNCIINLEKLNLRGGEYHFGIRIREKESTKIGIYRQKISVDSYDTQDLMVSDIELAYQISPKEAEGVFVKNGLWIMPNPSRTFDRSQSVYMYYEVYNLSKDTYGRTHFQTDYTVASLSGEKNVITQIVTGLGSLVGIDRKKGEITVSYEDRGTSETEIGYTSIDMSDSPPGEYQLTVTVQDLNSEERVEKSAIFTLLE